MASTTLSRSRSNPILLGVIFLVVTLSRSTACPDSCFCMDAFVTCSDFTFLDLTKLPPVTDTLILTRGQMDEIPSGFLANATKIMMLEMNSVNAKVIRRGAFSGVNHLDLFSITSSTFDTVESESFSNLSKVSRFLISESKFGRIDKHAFANVHQIADFRIWSNIIDVISDEAFYRLSEINSFQVYRNNITSLGNKLFWESYDMDDITIFNNNIEKVSEESFKNINDVTTRMVLHANVFICSCDIVWILDNQIFQEYLASNECIFPDHTGQEISKFRMADVTREALCPGISSADFTDSTDSDIGGTTDASNTRDVSSSTEDWIDSTDDLLMSTFSPRFRSTSSPDSVMSTASSESSTKIPKKKSSTTSRVDTTSRTRSSTKSPTTESSYKSPSTDFSIIFSTDTQFSDETDYPDDLTTSKKAAQTKDPVANKNTPDFLREVTPDGWTDPIHQASIDDIDKDEYARPYSTSANDMTTSVPDTASNPSHGNWLFIAVLSGLTLFLITAP